jgi:protein-S-isoprenylcysteine O-methyltransferase Ste14
MLLARRCETCHPFGRLENPKTKSLLPRIIGLGLFNQTILAVCLLVPGTRHFWQAWAFMAVTFVLTFFFCAYYYRRDPEFLARRLLRKEKIRAQRLIMFLAIIVSVIFYVLCGLDHRLGWSRTCLVAVPRWLTWLALLFYAGTYLLLFPVCNANRFAATIIQIEGGQTVADRGPYRLVRHPMYAVSLLVWLWIPLALGSFVVMPSVVIIALMLVVRLLNEERLLRQELPGYVEYCQRTPHRLIPFVW